MSILKYPSTNPPSPNLMLYNLVDNNKTWKISPEWNLFYSATQVLVGLLCSIVVSLRSL